MKYRMLTEQEMTLFDEDFKHFMVVNGVTNEEWAEMNQSDVPRAQKLVELFSDTVLQKVYEKVQYIEHRSKDACMVFKLGKKNIELISMNARGEGLDFRTPESIHKGLVHHSDQIQLFRTSKPYTTPREEEIHKMLMEGCVNSSEEFWRSLEKSME